MTSDLSFMILEAAHRLKTSCNLTIRVHDGLDPTLFRRGLEILLEDRKACPRFSGDSALVKGFMRNGYSAELARRRIAVGCNWMSLPGLEYTLNDLIKINLAKVFSVAYDEYSAQPGPKTTEELHRVYAGHLAKAVECVAEGIDFHLAHQYLNAPELTLNLLSHGPIEKGLDAANCVDWLKGLILDGIVAGVGAVLGFVPQMLVLFILLAILEACGYMARIAFVMDRIFRKFGLSGKSFIPILVGTGCGIPGIMASRTIENERDRRMTVMTTTFIPCGAKQPFIAMIAGAIFGGSAWIATGAYFLGMAAIVVSGIILKKTKMFAGDPAPFVMELPAYHMPTVGNVLRSMWERGWSFIKKAGTIITLSTIFVWFTSYFGWVDGAFQMLSEDQMSHSILAYIGKGICWIFAPLGWGDWQATVAAVTGLVAKENIVATMGILYGGGDGTYANLAAAFTGVAGMSFLIFNLLCAPCFAAMGAIKREMNNTKWFWFAIGYECGFAYVIALIVNQLGNLFTGQLMTAGNGVVNIISLIAAFALIVAMIYLLVRPYKESNKLGVKVKA